MISFSHRNGYKARSVTIKNVGKERQVLQVLQKKKVEGLILIPASTHHGEYLGKLQQYWLLVLLVLKKGEVEDESKLSG